MRRKHSDEEVASGWRSEEEQTALFMQRYTGELKNTWTGASTEPLPYLPERSNHQTGAATMKVIDEMHKWSWWKVIGWLIYLLFLAVLTFVLWYVIWWVATKAMTRNA